MNCSKHFAIWALALFVVCTPASAQDDTFSSFDEEFKKFQQDAEQEYTSFRDQCNAEYAKFLEEAWKSFKGEKPKPKPKDQPPLPTNIIEGLQNPQPIVENAEAKTDARFNFRGAFKAIKDFIKPKRPEPIFTDEEPKQSKQKQDDDFFAKSQKTQPKQEAKPVTKPAMKPVTPGRVSTASANSGSYLSFNFYGTKMEVCLGEIDQKLKLTNAQNTEVAEAWRTCSKPQYNDLIRDCLKLREDYNLCDWAYLEMLQTISDKYLGKGTNESIFLTAYIFCQSGYQIRLGADGNKLLLLYAAQDGMFGHPYYQIGNTRFYILNSSGGSMATINACDHEFSQKEQALSLLPYDSPKFSHADDGMRTIRSPHFDDFYISVAVNKNLIKFFESYPEAILKGVNNENFIDWTKYANTPLSEETKQQIYPQLRAKLNGLSQHDKVCRLLSLLQYGIPYEYDENVWKRDRAFFPEETLYYPQCDCEDRAILFSRLVRDIIGLKVALVYYPEKLGHLAAAVNFTDQSVTGDFVELEDGRFYICDPTNCDPEPGVTMRDEYNEKAQFFVLPI